MSGAGTRGLCCGEQWASPILAHCILSSVLLFVVGIRFLSELEAMDNVGVCDQCSVHIVKCRWVIGTCRLCLFQVLRALLLCVYGQRVRILTGSYVLNRMTRLQDLLVHHRWARLPCCSYLTQVIYIHRRQVCIQWKRAAFCLVLARSWMSRTYHPLFHHRTGSGTCCFVAIPMTPICG
ncbi:hypothetical protein BDZ97DRAFT_1828762 [Flammula alnicola]|nr:hypothetical protein BDZ97DRAFT_1828762 [Flammula alnicola]